MIHVTALLKILLRNNMKQATDLCVECTCFGVCYSARARCNKSCQLCTPRYMLSKFAIFCFIANGQSQKCHGLFCSLGQSFICCLCLLDCDGIDTLAAGLQIHNTWKSGKKQG